MASLTLRKSKDGVLIRHFYGKYTDVHGKPCVKTLNTPFEGKPPKSGKLSVDCGDSIFEKAKKPRNAKSMILKRK